MSSSPTTGFPRTAAVAVAAILCALSTCVTAWQKPPSRYNPLCPGYSLTNAAQSAKVKCYAKVLAHVLNQVQQTDPRDLMGSADIMAPWLTEDINARTSVGPFRGITLNAEYLAVFTATHAAYGRRVLPAVITSFTTTGNVAAVDWHYPIYILDQNRTSNFYFKGLFKFDRYNRVSAYDVEFVRFMSFLMDIGYRPGVPENEAMYTTAGIRVVCNVSATFCTGARKQYEDFDSCVAELSTKPYVHVSGDLYTDCISCRVIHALLLRMDPDLHCPHIGPSGGGACSNLPYSKYEGVFAQDEFQPIDPSLFDLSS